MIASQNSSTLQAWYAISAGNDLAYLLLSLFTFAFIFLYAYMVCPRVSHTICLATEKSWIQASDRTLPKVSLCVSMLLSIVELVQGLWYLIQGPSSLQAGYTRVGLPCPDTSSMHY